MKPLPGVQEHAADFYLLLQETPRHPAPPKPINTKPHTLLKPSHLLEPSILAHSKFKFQMAQFQPNIIFDDDDSSGSDRSEPDSAPPDPFGIFTRIGLRKLEENDPHCVTVKKVFAAGMQSAGAEVVAVHRNLFPGLTRKARMQSFLIFKKAVAEKCGGNANIGGGWYVGSRNMICCALMHGFTCARDPGPYGVSVHLIPDKRSFDAARYSCVDENGMRHLLLCKVILGKRELVPFGSKQCCPSSMKFDTGVDSLMDPKRIIIWSSDMNTHILPAFVVSFRTPANLRGIPRSIQPSAASAAAAVRQPAPTAARQPAPTAVRQPAHFAVRQAAPGAVRQAAPTGVRQPAPTAMRQPAPTAVRQAVRRSVSTRVDLNYMMNAFAEVLPAPRMVLLNKSVSDYRAKKISRDQLIRRMITLAGDELLNSVVKRCKWSGSNPAHQSDDMQE